MIYFCSDKNRRALVLATPALNGIDFLEVIGTGPSLQIVDSPAANSGRRFYRVRVLPP